MVLLSAHGLSKQAMACAQYARVSSLSLRNLSVLSAHSILSSQHQHQYVRQSNNVGQHNINLSTSISIRNFSVSKKNYSSWEDEYQGLIAQRNKNIIMHPDGLGQQILPGKYVIKKHPKTGVEKKVFLEHALGYFWAFKVCMLYDLCRLLLNCILVPYLMYVV